MSKQDRNLVLPNLALQPERQSTSNPSSLTNNASPEDIHVAIFKTLLNQHDTREVLLALQQQTSLSSGILAASYLNISLQYGADSATARLFNNASIAYSSRNYDGLVHSATRLINAGSLKEANAILSHLSEFAGQHLNTRILYLKYLFRDRRLDELRQQFENIPIRDYRVSEELLGLRIRYECDIGNPEAGLAWLTDLGAYETLSPRLIQSAIYCLISLARYDDVVPLLEIWLNLDFSYQYNAKHILLVATQTGETIRLIRAIEQLHGWFTSPDLIRLRSALITLDSTQQRIHNGNDQDHKPENTEQQEQSSLGVHPSPLHTVSESAIFFCTDAEYTAPAIVALISLALTIERSENLPDLYIFVLPETHSLWERIADNFNKEFSSLTLRVVSTLQMQLSQCRTKYGFNTMGDVQSTMAYARIYASRYLSQCGVARALYLDSDVVVQFSPLPLLYMDMEEFPLAACNDQIDPLVDKAIKLHGITNGRYFNSGVMLLDFHHPATLPAIEAAIAYSEDTDNLLIFQDQCALNKAIRGLYLPLDNKYNCYMPPGRPVSAIHENATIVHFVNTPKPWHLAYLGQGVTLWSRFYDHAVRIFGKDIFLSI
ncbi:glycosyltransferase family 8 protein [Pectobacterium zantedeschiae]|uniref:Glycosyl transferase n=1 Tax=Pectobacterium zantedeschiae TaxID=2034769 RepID=A0A9X8P5S7_9GAMM|nr:glycosyltransferase [Pectobacterium zantedeschiae]RYC44801.1 glycosyl transferase [Pectobacterium zantedeschiae]RYC48190.1 glycosyl transferase [Pectobacterium zantedeschiae]RYC49954.1 glycosyl transferase [Pectobacterium zantedeschiae]